MNDDDRALIEAMFAKDGISHKKSPQKRRPKKKASPAPENTPSQSTAVEAPEKPKAMSPAAQAFADRVGEAPRQKDHRKGKDARKPEEDTRKPPLGPKGPHKRDTPRRRDSRGHDSKPRKDHKHKDDKPTYALMAATKIDDKPTGAPLENNPLAQHLGLVPNKRADLLMASSKPKAKHEPKPKEEDIEKKRMALKEKLAAKKREKEEEEATLKYLESLDIKGSWADF